MHRAIARAPRPVSPPPLEHDPDLVRSYLEDAAHYPGGHATAVVRPHDVDEAAAIIREAARILTVGARSSLTGGATPAGDVVLSTERLQQIEIGDARVRVDAGVTLERLQQELAVHGCWLPPVPTFLGATAGGAVSTNAAGAATFKYGTTRQWVEGLTVILASGDVLAIRRGEITAADDGAFELETSKGRMRVPIPAVRMPKVPKCSAGYFSAPGMDLVDLFIGSEGTLGAIVDVTFRIQRRPAAVCWALVPLETEGKAIAVVDALRYAAAATWQSRDARGVDVAAIEHIDRRSLDILREDSVAKRLNIAVPPSADTVLIVQLELGDGDVGHDLWSELADARSPNAADTPLTRFCRMLNWYEVLDDAEIVLPHDSARRAAFAAFREAVPASVNRRVANAQASVDKRIHKTAADAIVPFPRFAEMMQTCRRLFADRQLDLAVWGHISDGNVHPNVVPRTYHDVEAAEEAILELGRDVIAMGGSPMAEHGVGRSTLKQQLLRMLYGEDGIDSMRQVKLSLDPQLKFARGVLFTEGGTFRPPLHAG